MPERATIALFSCEPLSRGTIDDRVLIPYPQRIHHMYKYTYIYNKLNKFAND
jgi:hypothetical protein